MKITDKWVVVIDVKEDQHLSLTEIFNSLIGAEHQDGYFYVVFTDDINNIQKFSWQDLWIKLVELGWSRQEGEQPPPEGVRLFDDGLGEEPVDPFENWIDSDIPKKDKEV